MNARFKAIGSALAVLILFAGCDPDKGTDSTPSSPLVGTWLGTILGTYNVNGVMLTFDKNDGFTLAGAPGTYSDDDGFTPARVDLAFDEDVIINTVNVGSNFFGIYEITGDTLKAAWDPATRPESFDTYGYHIWIRQ